MAAAAMIVGQTLESCYAKTYCLTMYLLSNNKQDTGHNACTLQGNLTG